MRGFVIGVGFGLATIAIYMITTKLF
ncbi:uncharacterized protein METZ01_LOCUS84801 [marine metagenome]|uniref:Uncharacterized protein n=1 Tax=marine metagenome TaxID=408172 RepID=A0A381UX44_9ZZZZ